MTAISDAPFFVDSRVTSGIQIADMAAGAIRIYQENDQYRNSSPGDAFLSAVRRYYGILQQKTRDQSTHEGYGRPGFYFMPESHHYMAVPLEEPLVESESDAE